MDISCVVEELDETIYRNLREEGLDGKAIQMWYGADVVIAGLNNTNISIVRTRHFDSLNSKFTRVSTTENEASSEKSRALGYSFLTHTNENWFSKIDTSNVLTMLQHGPDTSSINSCMCHTSACGTAFQFRIEGKSIASILYFCNGCSRVWFVVPSTDIKKIKI